MECGGYDLIGGDAMRCEGGKMRCVRSRYDTNGAVRWGSENGMEEVQRARGAAGRGACSHAAQSDPVASPLAWIVQPIRGVGGTPPLFGGRGHARSPWMDTLGCWKG